MRVPCNPIAAAPRRILAISRILNSSEHVMGLYAMKILFRVLLPLSTLETVAIMLYKKHVWTGEEIRI